MANLPDKLVSDIREFFDSTQELSDKERGIHDKFVYAIDLFFSHSPKEEQGGTKNSTLPAKQKTKVEIFELGEKFAENLEPLGLRCLTILAFCKWLKDNNHL